jgi:hypothetical protein
MRAPAATQKRGPTRPKRLRGLVILLAMLWSLRPAHAAPPETESAPPPETESAPPPETESPPPAEETPPAIEPPPPTTTEPPPTAIELPPEASDCEILNRGDPLYPISQAIGLMRTGRLEVLDCQQLIDAESDTRAIEARIRGPDQDLLLYRLERLTADGFEVLLEPVATHEVLLLARPAVSGAVLYGNVTRVSLHGTFVQGDDRNRLETIIDLRQGNFYPFEYATRLAELGYRAEFYPVALGEVVIEVRPGRAIRRVRLHGKIPLIKRDVLRQLSVDAQPGALARGQCVEPKRLRRGEHPPICDARDVACLEWERDELARLDQFLFDSGYFDGSSSLALVCGRASDEADLHVFLNKGRGYKVDRNGVTVIDEDAEGGEAAGGEPLQDRDVRWIRRQYIPRVFGLFRTRVTRDHMDRARERVTAAYADPNAGLGRFWRSDATTPYPTVEVHSSYEALTPTDTLPSHNIPVEVRISRGPGVQTEFRPVRGTESSRRRASRLEFSDGQLRNHIQLFNRREPASTAAAERESANLRAFYQSKGYLFARVEGEHFDFQSMDKLRFEIAEGPKVEIAEIEITRPARLNEAVAKRIERTWEDERKLRRRGKFSETDALADIQSVLAAYNAEGYLCADAYIYVGFWEEALDDQPANVGGLGDLGDQRPRQRAKLTVQDLLDSGGEAKWIEQFDPAGLSGVLAAERADIYVRLVVEPGPRLVTSSSEEVRFLDEPVPFSRKIEDPIVRDPADVEMTEGFIAESPLRNKDAEGPGGVPLSPDLDREVRNSIVAQYRNAGHPIADAELSWRYVSLTGQALESDAARNLPDTRFGICRNRAAEAEVAVTPIVNIYEGKPGEFGDILFRGNFKTRDWVLRRELAFESGDPYDQSLVDRSAASLESLGVAKSVTINPYPVGCHFSEPGVCQVHQVVSLGKPRTSR